MSYSLEEALGISKPKTSEPPMLQKVTPAKLSALERTEKFIEGLKQGKKVSVLAKELGVERMTLYRDFDDWLKTSGPAELYAEWLRDYEVVLLKNPSKAFECKTRLLCRILEKQAKVEVNVNQQLNLHSEIEQIIQFSRESSAKDGKQS